MVPRVGFEPKTKVVLPLSLPPKAVTDPDPAAAKRAFEAMMQMKKIDIAAIEAARRG